jgi:hypothetical protein
VGCWFYSPHWRCFGKAEEHSGIVELTAQLIRLRVDQDGYTKGLVGPHVDVYHIDRDNKAIAFRLWSEGGLATTASSLPISLTSISADMKPAFPLSASGGADSAAIANSGAPILVVTIPEILLPVTARMSARIAVVASKFHLTRR